MQTMSDKKLTDVNIGIFLKIEDCEGGGSSYMQGRLLFDFLR
jgi:hypothetical protein